LLVALAALPIQCATPQEEPRAMAEPAVSIWATGDGVRVNPETGRYFEDRTDIHRDYPTGSYRAHNAVWDSGRSRVTLSAARNEFVAFQVIVEANQPIQGITVRFDSLRGPGGSTLSGHDITLFKAWYLRAARPSSGYEKSSLGPGWYPDALLPAPAGEPVSFDIPDPRNAIGPTQRNQTVWVDLYVPRDRAAAPPGSYLGELSVVWPGGERKIAVELRVRDFALPDEIHCRGDIYNNSLARMDPDLELRYYQMCRQHGFDPGVYRYVPSLHAEGGKVAIDWSAYDSRLRRYLDGSAFTEQYGYWGRGRGVPIDHIILPFDCEKGGNRQRAWPTPMPEGGPTPEFEGAWVETARHFREHFDKDPNWRKVRKIVFLDGLDESYNDAAYEKMIYYSKLLRQGMGKGWFQFRIDGGYSWQAMEKLNPFVDLWVCHTVGFDGEKMAHFRELGTEPWFYGPMIYEQRANSACGSNTFLDLDLLTCRGLGWAAWKHKCGYCEWEFEWNTDRSWTDPMNWVTEYVSYNTSGLLIYRGEQMGLSGPIPSIRLKAQRRGFQDYEYFWLLQQASRGEEADRLVNSVIHTAPFGEASIGNTEIWKNNPEAWDQARVKAGEMLGSAG
jgi:hypothetical protein